MLDIDLTALNGEQIAKLFTTLVDIGAIKAAETVKAAGVALLGVEDFSDEVFWIWQSS